MRKLTKRSVEAIPPPEVGDVVVWDPGLPGFGVRVKPSGRRTYVVQYRTRDGRSRRVSLGRHGVLTLDEARRHARRMLVDAKEGEDPARRPKAAAFAAVAERYLREHAEVKKKPSSVATDRRLLAKLILPHLGTHPVAAITQDDVARLHHRLRGTPTQANRVLSLLSKVFNLAERWGLRPDGSNPCRHAERFRERPRKRYLSAEELARLGHALSEAEETGSEMASAVTAIRLLVLTGARLGEILALKWEDVDIAEAQLHLRDSKSGSKIILLGPSAVSVLEHAPRVQGSPFVCPGRHAKAPLVGIHKIWERIRAEANVDDVRLHDLRHTFAAFAAGAGLGLPVIGALLGHSQPATTARYAHLADDPLRRAVGLIEGRLDTALRGQNDKREDVPLSGDREP